MALSEGLVISLEVRRPSMNELYLNCVVSQVFVHLAFKLHSPFSSFKRKMWYIQGFFPL